MEDILSMGSLDNLDELDDIDDFEGLDDLEDTSSINEIDSIEDLEGLDESELDSLSDEFDNIDLDNSDDFTGGIETDDDLLDDSDTYTENDGIISSSGEFVIMKDDKENPFELKVVDINDIVVTPRIRQVSSVEDMVRSIKSTGLLLPVMVAPTMTENTYVLLDGWRRLMGCAKAGKRKITVIINNNISTPEIPIVESMYNHSRQYTMNEIITYIDYLEKEKGILNPTMIEYLLQLNSGDYTKLKDILSDNDPDIVEKLYEGVFTIDAAFKKLEQRRKKESVAEKEDKKAAKVYSDEEASGADQIAGSGEEVSEDGSLTEEQIKNLMSNVENLDEADEQDLGEMLEEDKNIKGFEAHKQKTGDREYIDPLIKKAVMARDKSTCQCCKRGGPQYTDILDYHHILPVFLGGSDVESNGIMLCVACHRLVHLYSTDDLHIDKALLEDNFDGLTDSQKEQYGNSEDIFEDEKKRFKRIIKLGSVIRNGIAAKGLNKKQYKEQHSNAGIGRRKPGVSSEQEKA